MVLPTAVHRTASIALTCAVLGACGSTPPPQEEISKAELSVTQAGESKAAQYAPTEMAKAQQELDAAHRAMDAESYLQARRLAEKALVDAQLAEAKAEAEQTKQAAAELQESLEALRRETTRSSGGGQ